MLGNHLQIYSDVPPPLGPSLLRRTIICAVVVCTSLVVPAATGMERSRVQRVPDTWATSASDASVYFVLGSASIDDTAAQIIEHHATRLRATPQLRVTVIAHTDDLGSSSLELATGQERLEAVRKRLEEAKISSTRIRTENHGSENRSAEPCADEECRGKNRRVDFLFHR